MMGWGKSVSERLTESFPDVNPTAPPSTGHFYCAALLLLPRRYKEDMAAINAHTAGSGSQTGPMGDEDEQMQANTKNLMNAVSSLPELTERKRVIDKHTNIATALLKEIKDRQIDAFCAVEEELFAGKADKSQVLKAISMPSGTASDKLRLVATWLLTAETLPPQQDFEEIEQVLRGAGADVQALAYVHTHAVSTLALLLPFFCVRR